LRTPVMIRSPCAATALVSAHNKTKPEAIILLASTYLRIPHMECCKDVSFELRVFTALVA
jgi:hypothetical protein